MSPDEPLTYKQLIDQLRRFCGEHKTGTVLIATEDNQLVRVLLEKGNITFLAFGQKQGQDAVPLIREIKTGRIKFSEGHVGSSGKQALPPTREVLQALAGTRATPAAALKIIENELIDVLGPMGSIICAEHLKKAGDLTQASALTDFINVVAREIKDATKTRRFKEEVLKKIGGS
ncbi:MAG TPA: hypothetical protein VK138_14760 [Acidiferrobacterales bacterium]|nr:hypothetical protein [Acidiferrobacterales bacterium]